MRLQVFEFYRTDPAGIQEYHSIKRQQIDGKLDPQPPRTSSPSAGSGGDPYDSNRAGVSSSLAATPTAREGERQ